MQFTANTPTMISSEITSEFPVKDNPYIAKSRLTYGYELLDLAKSISFSQMIFLMFNGELPTEKQTQTLDFLLVYLSNPGPRNGAVRGAMTAAISKTAPEHLLPIGLHILGGERGGMGEVIACAHLLKNPDTTLMERSEIPGFGTVYGGKDVLAEEHLHSIVTHASPDTFTYKALQIHKRMRDAGILDTGLCAAVGLDLGFHQRECGALFQMGRSLGILSHAMEHTHHPISSSQLLGDDMYDYQQS